MSGYSPSNCLIIDRQIIGSCKRRSFDERHVEPGIQSICWQRNPQYLLQIEVVFTYSSCNRGIPQDSGNAPEYGGHAGLP